MSLELLYYGAVAARDIVNLDAAWKMEWRDFLDCMVRLGVLGAVQHAMWCVTHGCIGARSLRGCSRTHRPRAPRRVGHGFTPRFTPRFTRRQVGERRDWTFPYKQEVRDRECPGPLTGG